jgi:ABC-type iron transport system FetAB ATPase subunit
MNDLEITDFIFQERGPYCLQIAGGRVTGLQGASGAGKTLLLRAIADLDPHQGQARLGDMHCTQVPAPVWRKTVALLPAESFWWFDRVGEHFLQPLQEESTARLEQLGFAREVMDWEVSRLSTGEKQRLAIARLLQNKPAALLLDEPTASLDAANIECVETLLLDYCRQQQVPLLWVSHDSGQLDRVADVRLFLEKDGTMQQRKGEDNGR